MNNIIKNALKVTITGTHLVDGTLILEPLFIFFLGGSVPTILQQVSVPIIENEKCQEMFTKSGHKKIVREAFLCAGYDEGKKDSCEVNV